MFLDLVDRSHQAWLDGYMSDTPADVIRARLQVRRNLPQPAQCRALRVAAGLSQQDMAEAVGVTRAAVSHWENGARRPRGQVLARYTEAIGALRSTA